MLIKIFAVIGVSITTFVVVLFTQEFLEWVKGEFHYLKAKHEYKHRFDMKPLAKCYCVNCDYWGASTGAETARCEHFTNRWTSDSDFCSQAKPMTKDGYVLREVREVRKVKEARAKEDANTA